MSIAYTAIAGAVIGIGASLSSAEDAEDAYHKQATIDYQAGQKAKEVAEYNAGVFRENALRIRNEQIARINDTYTVNHERTYESLNTNIARLDWAADQNASRLVDDYERYTGTAGREYSIVADRLNSDFSRISGQIVSDANKNIGQIDQVTNEAIRRLGRKAVESATEGFETENDYRQDVLFRISEQRSYYAAGNVLLNTGTPASLQLDMKQQGEVQALRIRRDYAIRVQDLHDTADDTARDALFKIDDIRTSANRAVNELDIKTFRGLEDSKNRLTDELTDLTTKGIRQYNDIETTRAWQVTDLHAEANRGIIDVDTGLAYDISDAMAEADNLDQQAVLAEMQGDAAAIAGVNRAGANRTAGNDAISNGYINAAAAGVNAYSSYKLNQPVT